MRFFLKAMTAFSAVLLVACSQPTEQARIQNLKESVRALQEPESFEEWHEALDAFHNVAFIQLADADPLTICQELSTWTNAEILAAEEFLASRPDLECADALLDQARSFTPVVNFQSFNFGNLSQCQRRPTHPRLGPSNEVILDTRGGKKLITGDLERCQVNFTFDDGPSAAYTEKLLASLAAQNVRVNFFTVGRNVSRLPSIVQKSKQMGHVWGNHSQTHANLPKLSNSAGRSEISLGFAALLKLADAVPPFFRFPYGAFTRYLQGELNNRNVAEFFWNMDTLDWKYKDPRVLYRNVLKEIEREKRGIILFHDVHAQTINVVPLILEDLRLANYETVVFVPKEQISKF